MGEYTDNAKNEKVRNLFVFVLCLFAWFGLVVVIIICGFGNYRRLIAFSLCVFSPCFFGQEIEVS